MSLAYFGLRSRVLALTAAVALPSVVAVIYAGIEQRRDAEGSAELAVFNLARIAATEHKRLLDDAQSLLAGLAKQPEIASGDAASCGAFLHRFLDSAGSYVNFGVVAADGEIVCSAKGQESALSLSDKTIFRRALDNGRAASAGIVADPTGHRAVFVVARPVPVGDTMGVIFTAATLDWLSGLVSRASVLGDSMTTVMDADFRVLARFPDHDEWVGRSVGDSALARAVIGNVDKGVARTTDLSGTDRLYGMAALYDAAGETTAYVTIGVSYDVALAAAEDASKRNLVAVVLLMMLFGAIAWWGGSAFVIRPIRQLIAVTGRMEKGDFSVRAPVTRADTELDELARAYNTMAESLARHERALQKHVEDFAFLNRVYAVSSASNGAILRIRDKSELLHEICRIAVEEGCFRAAWIGEFDKSKNSVVPVAHAGMPRRVVESLCTAANEQFSMGSMPTVVALRDGRYAVWGELQLQASAMRAIYAECGIRASAAFPLTVRSEVVGCLTLYAKEPDIFDTNELRLLQMVAADASFGLEYLEKEQQHEYLAYYDALTDLPNRRLFRDKVEQLLRREDEQSICCAVLVLGLRDLRRIGDTLGRHVSDAVVQQVARQLGRRNEQGQPLARLSQEEFAVICDAANREQIRRRADHILATLPRSIRVENQLINLAWSAGLAIYPDDAADADTLIRNAEHACHAAEASEHFAAVFYTPELEDQAKARLEMEAGLRDAVRNEEFSLYYQPVVDVHSGKTTSVEALLRWRHGQLGPLTAASFVPVAEETGLIVPIGEWVLAHAYAQSELWRKKGHGDVSIALNVSVKQLQQPDFATQMLALIDGGSKVSLALEVTESELIRNVQTTVELLRMLKQRGIAISVDDFGTGYSSLSYLQQLPIDVVKIDRSFVQDLAANPRTRAMVQAIIAMAHGLGLKVVAEGVERADELQILKEMDCDSVQGFYFGQPASGDDVEQCFKRNMLAA